MATENLAGSNPIGAVCSAIVENHRLVKWDTANAWQVLKTTAIAELPAGVSMQAGAINDQIPVQERGIAMITAKSAISVGDQVMAYAAGGTAADQGKIATAAGATAVSIGQALTAAAADGDVISVQLNLPAVRGPANT